MHGEALTATIDAWIQNLREECEIEIERRDKTEFGETLMIAADDNPWEERGDGEQQVSVIPPRDGKTRILFLGGGHDEERGLHFAYFDVQSSLGELVDVSDQHRIHIWFGPAPHEESVAAIRTRYEDAVRDGIWEHLLSVDHLIKALAPTTPLGANIADVVGRINRRMA